VGKLAADKPAAGRSVGGNSAADTPEAGNPAVGKAVAEMIPDVGNWAADNTAAEALAGDRRVADCSPAPVEADPFCNPLQHISELGLAH